MEPAEGARYIAREIAGAKYVELEGVDVLARALDLVVQVRPGREAGRAHVADHLALPHARAFVDAAGVGCHVTVRGFVAIGVADPDVVAVTGFPADFLNGAVA